jgi:hypothetical protein
MRLGLGITYACICPFAKKTRQPKRQASFQFPHVETAKLLILTIRQIVANDNMKYKQE